MLVLGFFTTDATVGIYSIASIFAEGMYQLLLILRINYDPLLARLIAERKADELRALIGLGKKLAYGAMAVAGVCAIIASRSRSDLWASDGPTKVHQPIIEKLGPSHWSMNFIHQRTRQRSRGSDGISAGPSKAASTYSMIAVDSVSTLSP